MTRAHFWKSPAAESRGYQYTFWVFQFSPFSGMLWTWKAPPVLRGLVQRDERVNRGEGACTGAFGIKPPQERTTSTACVGSVIRFLSTSGLRLVKTHASLSLPFLRGPRDGCALFMKQTQLRWEVWTVKSYFLNYLHFALFPPKLGLTGECAG